MLASSTPKPPPKPRRVYQDQLSFLDDLLEKKEDISIHEKLDIIIENQKAFFKFMADVMRGGFVGKHVSNDFNQGLGNVTNMERKSNVLEGRDRASSVSVWREGGSNVSVGRDRVSSTSEERGRASSVSVGRNGGSDVSEEKNGGSNVSVGRDRAFSVSVERDGASSVSVGRDEEANASVGRDRASSVSEERDWETSNFVTEDISFVVGGSCSLGEGYRENDIVSQGRGGTHQESLEDISNVMGRSGQGFTGNIVSRGRGGNEHGILGDITNVFERTSALEEGREIGCVSREQSLGEEDKLFMGEALVLKRSSCSVGNFATKFLSVIFKPEELINRNCTGTRGKGQLNAAKIDIVKKYVLKLYPCTPAQEDIVWRKCVVAIDEFLRRKRRDGRERRD